METLEPPESLESLREEVAELERVNARLRQRLARPSWSIVPGDPRLRVVLGVMIALLALVFGFGLYQGLHFDLADSARPVMPAG